MQPTKTKNIVSVDEFSNFLGCTSATVRRWIRNGDELPFGAKPHRANSASCKVPRYLIVLQNDPSDLYIEAKINDA
jgi:hypothetical protein